MHLAGVARRAAAAGGAELTRHFGKLRQIREKGRAGDLVTEADLAAEQAVLAVLAAESAGVAVLAEESGRSATRSDPSGALIRLMAPPTSPTPSRCLPPRWVSPGAVCRCWGRSRCRP